MRIGKIKVILLLLLIGCDHPKKLQYTVFSYQNEFGYSSLPLNGYNSSNDINGEWRFKDKNGGLIEKGKFSNGRKVGLWNYFLPNYSTPLKIDWTINDVKNFSLCIPTNWQLGIANDTLLVIKKRNDSIDYFSQNFITIEKIDFLESEEELFLKKKLQSIQDSTFLSIHHNELLLGKKKYFFSITTKEVDNEIKVLLSFFTNNEGKGYLIEYFGNNKSMPENYIFFFDFLRNSIIDDNRMLPLLGKDSLVINQI